MTWPFPSCCCWSPAGIASCCWWRAWGAIAGSARPSTMRPARPSTRRPRCWAWAIPAARRWSAQRPAGDPARIPLPRPMLGRPGADFSFSGLKTALRQRLAEAKERGEAGGDVSADLAASFQAAVIDCLADRTAHGIAMAKALAPVTALVVAGGVAANTRLRARLAEVAAGGRPAARRPAGQILHRQCGDDRLGRDRAAAPRPHRRPRFRAPTALAAGPDGQTRGPRLSDDEARRA